jgi:hypothetical protein
MSEHEQRAICKAAGLNIDPKTAEVLWEYGSGLDPYGLYDLTHEKDDYVQRNYFAGAPGGEVWVWFGDLPDKTRDALWERHKSRLAFPADTGFGPLPAGSPLIENHTAKKPRKLIVAKAVLRPDAIYALAGVYDDKPDKAALIGWEWGRRLLTAPSKDFGYGVLSHHLPWRELRPMAELKVLQAAWRALTGQSHGRA